MNFWTGVFIGVAATYALSIGALVVIFLLDLRTERRDAAHVAHAARAEHLRRILDCDPVSGESWSPEDSTVHFTHITGIGRYVRGRDD